MSKWENVFKGLKKADKDGKVEWFKVDFDTIKNTLLQKGAEAVTND